MFNHKKKIQQQPKKMWMQNAHKLSKNYISNTGSYKDLKHYDSELILNFFKKLIKSKKLAFYKGNLLKELNKFITF